MCKISNLLIYSYILIFSSKYYKEIYYDCIELGFEERRIKYNSYDLAVGFTLET